MKAAANLIAIFYCCQALAQAPAISWQLSIGGTNRDRADAICNTDDSCVLILGHVETSNVTLPDVDVFIAKIDLLGNIRWTRNIGGSHADYGSAIKKCIDGDFIVLGTTVSNDFDVSGNHSVAQDYWLVKIDSAGNILWQHCYGGSYHDYAFGVIQTSDGGFMLFGQATSNDGDLTGSHGNGDVWIIKTDTIGNIEWSKTYGGSDADFSFTGIQLDANSFIVAGSTNSIDGDVIGIHGAFTTDLWIFKIDSLRNIVWQRCYGGSNSELFGNFFFAPDSQYYICAGTCSNDGDVSNLLGACDYWLYKIDQNGNIIWSKTYGGINFESMGNGSLTHDNKIVMTGTSNIDNGMVIGGHGGNDVWIIETDSSGNLEWGKCLGGTSDDNGGDIIETIDHGFIAVGYAMSNDGDLTNNSGGEDIWVVKLNPPSLDINEVENTVMDVKLLVENKILSLQFFSRKNDNSAIVIYDISGRKIYDSFFQINEGINYISMPFNFPSGNYCVQIRGQKYSQNKMFIVQQ